MKKLLTSILTLLLTIALATSFTACGLNWDAGTGTPSTGGSSTGDQTSTPEPEEDNSEELALAEALSSYNNTKSLLLEMLNSQVLDEDGTTVLQDVYTRTSVNAVKEALGEFDTFDTEGKTAEDLNTETARLNAQLPNFVTVDSAIDNRLDTALKVFLPNLWLKYDQTYNDRIPYKSVAENAKGESGDVVYLAEDGKTPTTEKEGGKPFPIYGVSTIVYDDVTNSALFSLTADCVDMQLTSFVETGILFIFEEGFSDITKVEIVTGTDEEGNEQLYTMPITDFSQSGMYLAAGLIAVCAGFGADIFTSDDPMSTIVSQVKGQTFELIEETGCVAYVTFENADYTARLAFSIKFTAIPQE